MSAHAMAIIDKQKRWVYDNVSDSYKEATQNKICINSIHPIQTHDLTIVDSATGLVIGGKALDKGQRRIESQR